MKLNLKDVRWGLAVVGLLAAEASLIAASFAWVAVYSHLVNPGHPLSFYQQYAQATGPYIALLLGIPALFVVCRWIGLRAPSSARATALAVFALLCALIEIPTMLAFDNPVITPWFVAVALPVKLLSCLWGASTAQKPA